MDPSNPTEDMLPGERRQRLLDWFGNNVAGSTQELARLFKTSISTIRRDLDYLAMQHVVRRTHGGAVRVRRRATFEPTTDEASRSAVEEKRAIAHEAALRLERDQSILIDTGSTMHEFAHVVAGLTIPLTVVTSDILVASILTRKPHIEILMPGGHCREGAYSLLGEPGMSFLKDIRCDHFFLCSQAIDLSCASDTHLDLVLLKRAMMAAAETTTLLVDSSKFLARAIYRIAALDAIHEVITDGGLGQEERAGLRERGTRLTCVALPEPLEALDDPNA